jgi:hypothetical protein
MPEPKEGDEGFTFAVFGFHAIFGAVMVGLLSIPISGFVSRRQLRVRNKKLREDNQSPYDGTP